MRIRYWVGEGMGSGRVVIWRSLGPFQSVRVGVGMSGRGGTWTYSLICIPRILTIGDWDRVEIEQETGML